MRIRMLLILIACGVLPDLPAQDGLIIQEGTTGVCTMDGIIENSASGYTGDGYANIDNGTGIGMSWSVDIADEGDYDIYWRYALGGSDVTSRDAKLLLNNIATSDTVLFPHSGSSSWAEWIYTDTLTLHLQEGYNKFHLVSVTPKGLPNLDYFHILGPNIQAMECIPSYLFEIGLNDPDAGTVDHTPKQELYDAGTAITVTASANEGYFFHSWSGEAADTAMVHTFTIRENTHLEGLFYPEGTKADPEAIGYATVQHDNGTPYLLNGGAAGNTVRAGTLNELQAYLSAGFPLTVELDAHISGENTESIEITSDKTLVGIGDSAHIEGIPVSIDGGRNIIIKNITFSGVVRFDELEINGGARNIWIDHCDFYTDRNHGTDYYDGLLDIKNRSRFITVSWSRFHDHEKTILISSGDEETTDSVIRVTFHHNYFYNCDSRLPSIRFGKAHIFSNYYRNTGTAINTRMGACVRVEHNYFDNAGTAVGMLYTPEPGGVQLIDNIFINSGYSEEPTCELTVPYPYLFALHPAEQVPDTVIAGTGGPDPDLISLHQNFEDRIRIFPNPSRDRLWIRFDLARETPFDIALYTLPGECVMRENGRSIPAGEYQVSWDMGDLPGGVYICVLQNGISGEKHGMRMIFE